MKTVQIKTVGRKRKEIDIPESYSEAYGMLCEVMDGHYDGRGGNTARLSAAARVAYGLFRDDMTPQDPTIALIYLLQRLCKGEGQLRVDPRSDRQDQGRRR